MPDDPTSVLFVCLGNICRSPLAEGVFREQARRRAVLERFLVDSAGMGAWHVGAAPDPRAQEVARRFGIDIGGLRARQVQDEDFHDFDHLIAMDRSNLDELLDRAPPERRARVRLLRSLDPEGGLDVPDPYYGGAGGFENVYRMLDRCCAALLEELAGGGRAGAKSS